MAKAVRSLSPKQIQERIQQHRLAVIQFARLAAKNKVKEEMRDRGIRVTLVYPAEIMRQAREYLDTHPELYQQALERANRMYPLGAELLNDAQKQSEPKSTTSSVQMLGAK
jgi:hypothetical protein